MKYPKAYSLGDEPEEIRAGDLIWWNEGVCIGFVEEVMEQKEDYERWGLDEPSIAVTNLHPLEANSLKHKQHIGSPSNGGTVVYPQYILEDEGVGLLSPHEKDELNWAISTAHQAIHPEHRHLPFCVTTIMNPERREKGWVFHFVDEECQIVDFVAFPFRHQRE